MGMESFKQPLENKPLENKIEESEREKNRAREEFKQKEPFFLQAVQTAQNAEELKFAAKLGAVEITKGKDKVLWDEGMGTGALRWVELAITLEAIDNLAREGSTNNRDIPYSILERAKELFKQKE